MDRNVFSFLRSYSTEPTVVNRLIVSAFINFNSLTVKKNRLLLQYLINVKSDQVERTALEKFSELLSLASASFEMEHLIELFEFVISPSDKVVNGAIYTPSYIRDYIVRELGDQINKFDPHMLCCDISCGCGGFLLTISKLVRSRTGASFSKIYANNIFGLDITSYSLERAKLLLSLYAITQGEDVNFKFNLYQGNALSFDWNQNCPAFAKKTGFDIIAGNPPYVASRNMENESILLLERWKVTKTGHPDLYIPFFQIGYELLNKSGILGYITVNTFFKSINGRALRQYFTENSPELTIINFGGEQVFKGRNTYTCICFIHKQSGRLAYSDAKSTELEILQKEKFNHYDYIDLDDWNGWNLTSLTKDNLFIKNVESIGTHFSKRFKTRNGIATLKNDIYKFKPQREDSKYYYFTLNRKEIRVEKAVCRDIVNANKLKTTDDLITKREKIIYPYFDDNGRSVIIPEQKIKRNYPRCYEYLSSQKSDLAKRDKGEGSYETWYAYGRRQSLDISAYKLFFPHISERPSFVISDDKDLLFYNGIAVISNDMEELRCLKYILESNIFFKYLKLVAKDYASGYISMSKNYIKNFGVIALTPEVRKSLLSNNDSKKKVSELYEMIIDAESKHVN